LENQFWSITAVVFSLIFWLIFSYLLAIFNNDPENIDEKQFSSMDLMRARALFGLKKTAGIEEINAAHDCLMKKTKPSDQGYEKIVEKLNAAKDLLIKNQS
jgi:hypothetical protein